LNKHIYCHFSGSSALDKKGQVEKKDDVDDDVENNDDDYSTSSMQRRNRYSGYGSAMNNHRSRSRWPAVSDDASDSNEWARFNGIGLK
jgi:hypothetical protein